MAINWSRDLYRLCQGAFAVPVTVHPIESQPGGASYPNRGIFHKRELEVMAEDGSMFSDHEDVLDIRMLEFPVLPQQKDRITIPFNSSGEPQGDFEVTDRSENGGGEMTLVLRKIETKSGPEPTPYPR